MEKNEKNAGTPVHYYTDAKIVFAVSEGVIPDGNGGYRSPKSIQEFNEITENGPQMQYNLVIFCPECGQVAGVINNYPDRILYRKEPADIECGCGKFSYHGIINNNWRDIDGTEQTGAKLMPPVWDLGIGYNEEPEIKPSDPVFILLTNSKTQEIPYRVTSWGKHDGKLGIETAVLRVSAMCFGGHRWLKKKVIDRHFTFNFDTGKSYNYDVVQGKRMPGVRRIAYNAVYGPTMGTDALIRKLYAESAGHPVCEAPSQDCHMQLYPADTSFRSLYPWKKDGVYRDFRIVRRGEADIMAFYLKGWDSVCLPKWMKVKSVKKKIASDPMMAYLYEWLRAIGVKDINIANYFMDFCDMYGHMDDETSLRNSQYTLMGIMARILERGPALTRFMKEVLPKVSVKRQKILLKDAVLHISELGDTARMYDRIRQRRPDMEIDVSGNLKEMHDRFMLADRKLQAENCPIAYTKEEQLLAGTYGGVEFRLPADTDTLYETGKLMGICVGSYGENAVMKRTLIVQMVKENHYVGCIELTPFRKGCPVIAVQIKGKYNNPITEKTAFEKWADACSIEYRTCDDYRRIGTDAGTSHRNWAVDNPNGMGNVLGVGDAIPDPEEVPSGFPVPAEDWMDLPFQ